LNKSCSDPKKGADGGIDGHIYFKPDGKTTEKAIVSVEGGDNVQASMVRDLAHVVDREKAKIGVFITLAEPTAPMKTEAVKAGYYETEFGKYPKIQIVTIKELFDGKKPAIPLVHTWSSGKSRALVLEQPLLLSCYATKAGVSAGPAEPQTTTSRNKKPAGLCSSCSFPDNPPSVPTFSGRRILMPIPLASQSIRNPGNVG
jgi:hypothetical protein